MSNLSICKIGVGPSSSHTLGPLIAGNRFCEQIAPKLESIAHITITLYGSLSLTGRGHLSDKAILWGLENLEAKTLTKDLQAATLTRVYDTKQLNLCGAKLIDFDSSSDIIFSDEFLPQHENALRIEAYNTQGAKVDSSTYFSIGGGFVKSVQELESSQEEKLDSDRKSVV